VSECERVARLRPARCLGLREPGEEEVAGPPTSPLRPATLLRVLTGNLRRRPGHHAANSPRPSHPSPRRPGKSPYRWSIKKFVRTARRYRTITIQAGPHTITAADPVPDELRAALTKINSASWGAH
jgi:hypothetical protein